MKLVFLSISFFFILVSIANSQTKLQTGYYFVVEKSDSAVYLTGKNDSLYLNKTPIITVRDFKRIKVKGSSFQTSIVQIYLTDKAKEPFKIATSKWIGNKIAFVIDSKIIMVPIVMAEIPDGKIWMSGVSENGVNNTRKELLTIKKTIEDEIKTAQNK